MGRTLLERPKRPLFRQLCRNASYARKPNKDCRTDARRYAKHKVTSYGHEQEI